MIDIDALLFKADSENMFMKFLVRKYNFVLTFRNYHELSVMFETLHVLDLSLQKLTCIGNKFSCLGVTFLYENNQEKVRKFVEKIVKEEIKIVAGID